MKNLGEVIISKNIIEKKGLLKWCIRKEKIILFMLLLNNALYSLPKMISIQNEELLNIEMSETVITVSDYKEYIKKTNLCSIDDLESEMKRLIDEQNYCINDNLPLWGLTWIEAVEYCNWLSNEFNLEPYYIFSENVYGIKEVNINQKSNGFRLPYVRELLIISGIREGLSKTKYENENTNGIKSDINHFQILPVQEGKRNRYGVYDILGNIRQYCSDYYNTEYDYFDYTLSYYGPNNFTPDPDVPVSQLSSERCYFGGAFYSTYEKIQKNVIYGVNDQDKWTISGIRLVRNLNPGKIVDGKK